MSEPLTAPHSSARAGWKLVPTEATRAMKDAVSRKVDDFSREHARLFADEVWAEMLAAAPASQPSDAFQDTVQALNKAIGLAEERAGTLPAKESVKLRPADWHAVCRLVRSLSSSLAQEHGL